MYTVLILNANNLTNKRKLQKHLLIYISNKMQRYTVYFIWKLLHIFWVVPPPIIRSTYNCIYSIWYLSHRYCYLPLVAGSCNGVTNTRCCSYSCMCSWWWVGIPPEHVEQFLDIIHCVTLHLVGYILEYFYDARTHESQMQKHISKNHGVGFIIFILCIAGPNSNDDRLIECLQIHWGLSIPLR